MIGATAFGGDLTLAMKALAPGMMVMGIIFFMGTISGAHLNPAVTLAFAVRGNFPWRRVPGYIVAQVIGAVLAAGFLQLMYGGIINGATEPTPDVSLWVAMLTEAVLTLGLVSVILGTASGARNVGINGALAVGAYIGLVSVWGAPVSGASMNPARSFGPGARRLGPDQLLDLPGRTDHRRDDRRRLRVHPQGQANQGRRRSRPRHPRREPPRNLTATEIVVIRPVSKVIFETVAQGLNRRTVAGLGSPHLRRVLALARDLLGFVPHPNPQPFPAPGWPRSTVPPPRASSRRDPRLRKRHHRTHPSRPRSLTEPVELDSIKPALPALACASTVTSSRSAEPSSSTTDRRPCRWARAPAAALSRAHDLAAIVAAVQD